MKTVHIILSAHLDPIWLWSWRDGLDEVLNTCHTICNLLDRHPDIIHTRGEAWVYQQIQNLDPQLFRRIQGHVQAGRWATVGGWYVQPDCNLPSGFAMEKQIQTGAALFQDYFGAVPRVAFNVDSFGHAASLPAYMRAAGQDAYVMMRPQEHEMILPARLFRWRGFADGPEVTTFRIAKTYCTNMISDSDLEEHLQASLTGLPDGISHTMCFIGIGDHGGGPNEDLIDWCRANEERKDCRLVFSTPERFFAAVAGEHGRLPVVTGELQPHAIGCYSAYRPAKTLLKRAEHRLAQADHAAAATPELAADLLKAWSRVCFHHFHDTLGGTCLPSAYRDVEEQLGQALAVGDEILATALRRRVVALPDFARQRLIFWNPSECAYDDYFEVEPWLEWSKWQKKWGLQDERGRNISLQVMQAESAGENETRLLFRLQVAPAECRILSIVDQAGESGGWPENAPCLPKTGRHPAVELVSPGSLRFPGFASVSLPELQSYPDPTDTWSHGIHAYHRENPDSVQWSDAEGIDAGPLMVSVFRRGALGGNEVSTEWRSYYDMPWIDCHLRILWTQPRRLLKLEWNLPGAFSVREDGIMGGSLKRPANGNECPMRDWTLLREDSGECALAVISPDVFALDSDPGRLRLTLLRSCPLACHDPNTGSHPRTVFGDLGSHDFHFRFLMAGKISTGELDAFAQGLNRRPLSATTTRGMPKRAGFGKFQP